MKVVVIGAGAMGSLFGGRLARAGHAVVFVDADPGRVDAIAAAGIVENGLATPCRAAVPGTIDSPADLVIVFTKTMFTSAAIEQNPGAIGADTVVLTLQNGLGNAERIAAVVGPERVLLGVTNWPADLVDHGSIHVGGEGTVKLWSFDGQDRPAIYAVVAALDAAGLRASATRDIVAQVWEKVIFNAALNGVAALTRMTVGQIGDFAPTRDLAFAIVEEGLAIAAGQGIALDPAAVRGAVSFALAHHRDHKASMLQDIEAGRPTEVDSIQGGLLDAAVAAGMAVPHLRACTALLKGLERGAGARSR